MSDLDVSKLRGETLAEGQFPARAQADFRLYFAPSAHEGIIDHAHQDLSVEICGILVGEWRKDENGPYAVIDNYIRCDSATSKFAEVTFTHESWAKINEEMDSRFEDKRIVGWYHSHPDFGIFLSDRDCFIHQHFFSGAGQVAFVVDPVRQLEGVFAWKNGKPAPMRHYWVGDSISTVQASVSNPAADERNRLAHAREANDGVFENGRQRTSDFPLVTTLLGVLAIFLLGYVASGWQREWERQAMVDGIVANYTNFKLVKFGLREELAKLHNQLLATQRLLEETPVTTEGLSDEDLKSLTTARKLIVANLGDVNQSLVRLSSRYGFSDQEMRALARIQQQLDAQQRQSAAQKKSTAPAAAGSPKSDLDAQEPKAEGDKTESVAEVGVGEAETANKAAAGGGANEEGESSEVSQD